MDLVEKFEDAQKRVKTLPTATPDQLLKLYGLFKQGTVGDATGKRPGMLDIKGRAKFDAWSARKGMSRERAMEEYAEYVDSLLGR